MNPAKYSFSWADGVVKKLTESYPRATEISWRMLGITHRDAVKFLAFGDPVFADLRNLIHFVNSMFISGQNHYTDEEYLARIRLYWRCKSKERIFSRLDKVQKRRKLEEQGSR